MQLKRFILFFATISSFMIYPDILLSQALYSYLDEDGIQHFTNIPPVKRVWNLKVSGSEPEPAVQPAVVSPKSEPFVPIIEKYARENQLDPSLIHSIIAAESNFNPKAVSPKGARGLMQLMPATAARLGVENSFDPEQNIKGGVRHFRWLMDNFNNNLNLSLAAYNAGENLVQRLGRVPEIKETKEYVRKITKQYDKKQLSAQAEPEPKITPTYRYLDEAGVLHLTNIPPLQ